MILCPAPPDRGKKIPNLAKNPEFEATDGAIKRGGRANRGALNALLKQFEAKKCGFWKRKLA